MLIIISIIKMIIWPKNLFGLVVNSFLDTGRTLTIKIGYQFINYLTIKIGFYFMIFFVVYGTLTNTIWLKIIWYAMQPSCDKEENNLYFKNNKKMCTIK